jgi:manganese-dependent ADP-ribose/CDP-alcohol diphosphatase
MKLLFLTLFASSIFFPMPGNKDISDKPLQNQSQAPLFSFGILADVQYSSYDAAGTRFYRNSLAKLRQAIKSFEKDSVDFIVNLGDLIDKDFESYNPVMSIIDSSYIKTWHITGNHDYSVENRYKKKLPQLSKEKAGYYSFVHKGFRFIFLNGNEISTYSTTNKATVKSAEELIASIISAGGINGEEWNGGVSDLQCQWLNAQLIQSSDNGEKAFIFCHFPVYPENNHSLLNYNKVLSVLEKHHNVIAWINGHNHAGNYGNFNTTHFVTFKGMVETENTNSFAAIDVYKNKIWIRGSGREKSMILAY